MARGLRHGAALAFGLFSERVATVLDEGELDTTSRTRLADLHRTMSTIAAELTVQPQLEAPAEDSDEAWYRSWRDHVAALPTVVNPLGTPWLTPFGDARLVWLDELDAMSDEQLLKLRGLGPKTLEKIRATLATYYWRAEETASRELWTDLAGTLRDRLEREYARDEFHRARLECGAVFAERVLAENGAPLADPKAPRMVP